MQSVTPESHKSILPPLIGLDGKSHHTGGRMSGMAGESLAVYHDT